MLTTLIKVEIGVKIIIIKKVTKIRSKQIKRRAEVGSLEEVVAAAEAAVVAAVEEAAVVEVVDEETS